MSEVGSAIKEIAKLRLGKLLLNIVMIITIIITLYSSISHFVQCYKGKNSVLFWGMTECRECQNASKDVLVKHDTFFVEVPAVLQKASKNTSVSPKKVDKAVQKIGNEGSGILNNGSTNYGQQAGRDINNYGIIPRQIDEMNLFNFFAAYPDKNVRIAFRYFGSPDAEMISAKNQIDQILRKNRYTNIGSAAAFAMSSSIPPDIFFEPQGDGSVYICIPPKQ